MARGVSLHIGIDFVNAAHYAGWTGPLAACEKDANDMAALAEAQGFERTVKLLSPKATRDAVKAAIQEAAGQLQAGDLFLCTYAGHGYQMKTNEHVTDDAEDDDGKDESWCLFDGMMLDDELYDLWADFAAGVRIHVLSDSCHSGTVTRVTPDFEDDGPLEPASREMPPPVGRQVEKRNGPLYAARKAALPIPPREVGATVRLFSGCQDDQEAADGMENGLFTSKVKAVWANGAFRGDHAAFIQEIVSKMPKTQRPNHTVEGAPDPAWERQRPFDIAE